MSLPYHSLSITKLQSIKLTVGEGVNQPTINEVYFKLLNRHVDARGDLIELWSQPWSNKEPISSVIKHVYYNTTHQGVIKAWHVHEKTISQYTCVTGKLQVVLVDVRPSSSTFGQVNQFMMGTFDPGYLQIPPGVLKGWKSVQGDSVVVNLLTSADIKDNFKYHWDDILPDIWWPKNG